MSRLQVVNPVSLLFILLMLCACGEQGHKDHGHGHHDHDHDHDHDHSGPNAHLWLDPVLTRQFAQMVAGPVQETLAAAAKENRKATIVVSIHPVASLVRDLVADDANVITLLPQGGSPHGFDLTPDLLQSLSKADLLIIVGLSLDPWAEKAALNANSKSLVITRFIDLVTQLQDGKAAPVLADGPLKDRAAALDQKLAALHEKYIAALAKVMRKELVTFHNAFDLLAQRYGLSVVAHLTEMDLPTGAEVTPGHLREARDAVKKHKLKTIYAEPAYPDGALHAIAEATGAAILRLDDLGGPDREGYRTYFEMMESNLKVLVDGQSR